MFVPFALGKYTVVGNMRFGGMGEVLKAESVSEDGVVEKWAVKRPLPTVAEDPDLLSLFWKEAELVRMFKHRAFPKVVDVGVAKGLPYMVMELVEGVTVARLVEHCEAQETSPVRPETWVYLASELAQAVEHIHRFSRGNQKLVHGDIGMTNVMVDLNGQLRVIDMGVALADVDLLRRVLTRRGEVPPSFLTEVGKSPELDTYAIGKLLVRCLGGVAAIDGHKRLPRPLVEIIKRSVDQTGLYLFRTARGLRRELAAHLDSSKEEKMTTELADAVSNALS
jgi:eukaryotic-like serine/threonine-protein kinase